MNIYTIDSKIAARTYALTMAVKLIGSAYKGMGTYNVTCIDLAKRFENYLIGKADLPEIKEDPTKDWIETMKSIHEQQSIEEIEKRDNDWKEFMNNIAKQIDENNAKLGIK